MSERETMEYDVVVVGGGVAGLSAACSAAEAGARVALLERSIGKRRPEYASYVARTSAFLPRPPRRMA